jgi:hypothetical protein
MSCRYHRSSVSGVTSVSSSFSTFSPEYLHVRPRLAGLADAAQHNFFCHDYSGEYVIDPVRDDDV